MLVLRRKEGESVLIQGAGTLKILEIRGTTVKIGFDMPNTEITRPEAAKAPEPPKTEK